MPKAMNTIIIDSAFDAISILGKGVEGVYSSSFKPCNRQRGRSLQRHMEIVAKEAGFSISECELIGVPEGPGSFTGLRLAYSVGKAISFASGAKMFSVPTLSIFDFSQKHYNGALIAMIDAKRDCFYAQVFKEHQKITPIYDAPISSFLDKIDLSKPCVVVGIGTEAFKKDIEKIDVGDYIKDDTKIECLSQNMYFIELSQSAIVSYILDYIIEEKDDIKLVKDYDGPLYVRPSDAERDSKTRV